MKKLVEAEGAPILPVGELPAVVVDDLLFGPIDMIMNEKFAGEQRDRETRAATRKQDEDRRRQQDMNEGVEQPARRAVNS